MTRINEVLYFVLYDLCKIKNTQNKSASVFSIGTPEWNRTTAHGSGELREKACNTAFCKGLSGFIAYFFITVECHFPNINFSNCTHNCTQLIN